MTIASTQTLWQYNGNGATTAFAYNAKITAPADLAVGLFNPDGTYVPKVLNTDYTVTGAGTDTGGSVNFTVPPPAGTLNVDIRSNVPVIQGTSIKNQGQFLPELHEDALDRLTRIVQDLTRKSYAFGIHGPDNEPVAWPALPSPAARRGMNLIFDGVTGLPAIGAPSTITYTQGTLGQLLFPQTAAEIAAGAVPVTYAYDESDIRRYGALTANADNSAAINLALSVSSNGGKPCYLPAGTWKHTSTLTIPANASMYGAGWGSILAPQDVDGLTFAAGASYGLASGVTRFFADFQVINSNSTNSTKAGIVVNFSAASGNKVTNVHFRGLYFSNFNAAANLRGLWNSSFQDCFFYNVYQGFYFNGQNIKNVVHNCQAIRGTITGVGGLGSSWGISFQQTAGETTQSTQVYGSYFYGFDRGLHALLAFELQVEFCDISQCLESGVNIVTTLGGVWVRDCWIEVNAATAIRGVNIADLAAVNNGDIHIIGNHIQNSYGPSSANCIGVYSGYNQVGVTIEDNSIGNFDRGIDTSMATVGQISGVTVRDNKINCVTPVYSATSFAIRIHTNAANTSVGPNYIVQGTPQACTNMANASANITVPNGALFPVGTPVQFDQTLNGLTFGVTYFVLTVVGNVITVAPYAGGAAIVLTAGTTPLNILQSPLQVTYTSTTPPGIKFYGSGTFIGTFTGYAANQLLPVKWTSDGSNVTLDANTTGLSATSTTTAMTLLGVPTMIVPPTPKGFAGIVVDNSVRTLGWSTITNTTITFSSTMNGAAMTNANNKGVTGDFARWSLN